MALASKKSEAVHSKSGSEKAKIKASFDAGTHTTLDVYPGEAALIYQMQQMQEDIDELRRYIVSAELLLAAPGTNLPTSNPNAKGSKLLWNKSGLVAVG